MSNQHFYRVHFAEGESRVVLAADAESAKRVGRFAHRLTGRRKLACRPVTAADEGHAGTGADSCPVCTAPGYKRRGRTVSMAEWFDFGRYLREVPANG